MATTISMKHPQFPEDYTFGIPSIGVLRNDGTPLEVDDDDLAMFEERFGTTLEDYYRSDMFTINSNAPDRPKQEEVTQPDELDEQPEAEPTTEFPGE